VLHLQKESPVIFLTHVPFSQGGVQPKSPAVTNLLHSEHSVVVVTSNSQLGHVK
jgi:hypothetical protein